MKECVVKLSNGKYAQVDDEDFYAVRDFKWHERKVIDKYYAVRNITYKRYDYGHEQMHRQILNPPDNMWVDHINGNGLDNRKTNLRLCLPSQNQWNKRIQKNNTSGFKGVFRDRKKWRASLTYKNKQLYFGSFSDIVKAAQSYDEAAKKYYGEFAMTNENLGLYDKFGKATVV